MRNSCVLLVGALSACSADTQAPRNDVALDSIVVATVLDLPRCTRRGSVLGAREGEVRYVARESKLYACVSGDWQVVSTSMQGVRTSVVPPGNICERGGFRVEVGNDSDGDGVLSDAEVTGSALHCDAHKYLEVTAGQWHSCGLVSDGSVRCWGWNNAAELGDGTYNQSFVPVIVMKMSNVTTIAGGNYHTCALLDDTTVQCWGEGFGDEFSHGPGVHVGLFDVIAIAAGDDTAWAVLRDGSVYQWSAEEPTPRPFERLPPATAIAGGVSHTCALLRDNSVRCWGSNSQGQLGDGTLQDSDTPVSVTSLGAVRSIAAAAGATCALLMDGRVACWGGLLLSDAWGPEQNATPTIVPNVAGATAISVGTSPHACAILEDGSARCWGSNGDGQLGGGSNRENFAHVVGLDDIIAIDAGKEHSCAVTRDGNAYCWGSNEFGQLGDGTTAYRHSPGLVLPP